MIAVRRPRAIVIDGQDAIAEELAAAFARAGRPLVRLRELTGDRARRALRGAECLILTAGADVAPSLVSAVAAARPRRVAPLRLILVAEREAPAPPGPPAAALRIQRYAIEEAAARALLTRWPLHGGLDPGFGQVVHLLIAGIAPPARALVLQALRLIHYGGATPVVTLASHDPELARAQLLTAHPQAERIARLRFVDLAAPLADALPPVTAAYVCMNPAEAGLDAAARLANEIRLRQGVAPAIHLEIGTAAPGGDIADWDGQLLPFSYRREACHPEILLDGRGDELARTIHEHYRDSIAIQDRDPDAAPAGQPWEDLADSYRQASRHQADHLWAKLALCDCRALPEELVETFTFSPLEVERLAEIEHSRWAADRYLGGWTHGPTRDEHQRRHPQLVPYHELSEPMKDLDRFAVRLTPILLARYGRGLVRMLIVGLPEPHNPAPVDRRLLALVDALLDRLLARYPDRSLVLAATLAGAATRAIACRALHGRAAGLFLLCPEPLPTLLAAQPDAGARRELLGLVARAERRIALPGTGALAAWYAERAEILVSLGETPPPAAAKPVQLDPRAGRLEWGFEY